MDSNSSKVYKQDLVFPQLSPLSHMLLVLVDEIPEEAEDTFPLKETQMLFHRNQ